MNDEKINKIMKKGWSDGCSKPRVDYSTMYAPAEQTWYRFGWFAAYEADTVRENYLPNEIGGDA